jgi:ribosomal-protein-alanine N-acetyltransferase
MQLTFACNCESPVLSGLPVIRPAYPCVRVTEVSSPHFPALSTERLTLRVIAPHDVAEFRALMSVPEVTRYSNWPEAPTYDQANEWTRNLAELFPSGKGCAWVIAERSSGGFHRRRSLQLLLLGMEGRSIGYEAHPDYCGRGLTTEALRAVVTYGHRAFALNRIEAWTLPGNDASDRVLEKAGFRFEGIFREKGFFKGAFHDFRMFGRVAADAVMDAPIGDDRPVAAE